MIDDIGQFNAWIEFTTQVISHWLLSLIILTFDGDDLIFGILCCLANYQFVDWFGATLRYSHEDLKMISDLIGDLDYE